ncbi:MAG: hypothetical protein WC708_06005 [Lentisphaeria bacterium]
MTGFRGQERCQVDGNGRVRLPPAMDADFRQASVLEVALHLLPEGGLAVYPLPVWEQLRAQDTQTAPQAAVSVRARRHLRRFGAMTTVEKLSNQGRITIPPLFRGLLGLDPGAAAVVAGCELGVEIWNADRWQQELEAVRQQEQRREEAEMQAEIAGIRGSPDRG